MVQIHCSFVSVWVVRSEGSTDGRNNVVITIFDSGKQEAESLQEHDPTSLPTSKTTENSRRSRIPMTSWGTFKGVTRYGEKTKGVSRKREIKGSKRNICNINRKCSCTCADGGCPPAEVDDVFDEIHQEFQLSTTGQRENDPESVLYAVIAKSVEVYFSFFFFASRPTLWR